MRYDFMRFNFAKRKVLFWECFGFLFISLLGYIIHSGTDYIDFLNKIPFIFARNESVFEHLKLVFWPVIFLIILELFFIRNCSYNFMFAKLLSILIMIFIIITFFYSYTGIIGTHYLAMDLFIFHFAVFLGQLVSFKILIHEKFKTSTLLNVFSLIIILILIYLFIYLSYYPLNIPMFLS